METCLVPRKEKQNRDVKMDLNILKKNPFYLSDEDICWVRETYDSLSTEEKIGQLFFMVGRSVDEKYFTHITKDIGVGGLMCRSFAKEDVIKTVEILQKNSKIPMLIAANLESGGYGITTDGTKIGSNMMVSATNDKKYAGHLGRICGIEGRAVGANYAFAPVCDIDYNYRNPITNTRTFGSNPDHVLECSLEYMKACQNEGLAVSIKHFPGDGVDDRDQHLVTSINSLSVEDWDKSYGMIYKSLIENGAKTVMVGHIMQPAYSKYLNPNLKDSEIMPATLSEELLNGLLREKLGFNGLIITDATTMAGFNIPMPRNLAVPYAIQRGCDMFLFTKNLDEDISFMMDGYNKGIITEERLEDAVLRILALKASLKLHKKNNIPTIEKANELLKQKEALMIAKEVADKSITLVKEQKGILPLSPIKHKRILLHSIESGENALGYVRQSIIEEFKERMEASGFDVTIFKPGDRFEGLQSRFNDTLSNYDLIIYIANLATKSNQTTVRIEWMNPMGVNVPYYIESVPTIFISTENPYHLQDVPRVKTFINTYGVNECTIEMLVDKLLGNSEFKGVSPIDPFCGRFDTRL